MRTSTVVKAAIAGLLLVVQTVATADAQSKPLYYGYYYADGRWGDFTHIVWPYTNLYIAIPGGYDTAVDWRPLFRTSIHRAHESGKAVMVILGDDPKRAVPVTIDAVLTIMTPYWDKVVMLEVAHEEDLTADVVEQRIGAVKRRLDAHGLAHKPFGMTYTRSQALTAEGMRAPSVSWVAIEAFVDPDTVNHGTNCSHTPAAPFPGPLFVPNADCTGWVPHDHPLAKLPDSATDLNQFLTQARRRMPRDKQLALIMQAYDRNGKWKNPETLAAMQLPVFRHAQEDPRVTAILMFSYGYPGGTRSYPRLQEIHQQIGEQILGSGR